MAIDDVTTVISANLSAGGTVDRQPSAGVEELCLDLDAVTTEGAAPDGTPAVEFKRIDGTNNDAIFFTGDNGSGAATWMRMKPMADNTNYFRFINRGAQGDLTFAIIQVG